MIKRILQAIGTATVGTAWIAYLNAELNNPMATLATEFISMLALAVIASIWVVPAFIASFKKVELN